MHAIDAPLIVGATSFRLLDEGSSFAGEPLSDTVHGRLHNGSMARLGQHCGVQCAIGGTVRSAPGAFVSS